MWFEELRWPGEQRECPRCFSERTRPVKSSKPMPYWCAECRKYFSVKTGTAMEASNIPLRKWVIGMYLMTTSLKGVSSMKLHRDLDIAQSSAWFMAQRIREGWNVHYDDFEGPVEADETYIGGKPRKGQSKRGRGTNKQPVIGIRDRATNLIDAKPIPNVGKQVLHEFVQGKTREGATVYTDGWKEYIGVSQHHETVNHGSKEYVRGQAHVNGIESFWGLLKRGYQGVYRKMSPKHLHRYVNEFAGRHNSEVVRYWPRPVDMPSRTINSRDGLPDPQEAGLVDGLLTRLSPILTFDAARGVTRWFTTFARVLYNDSMTLTYIVDRARLRECPSFVYSTDRGVGS